MLLYVNRDHRDYYGHGAQGDHLDLHTAPELCNWRVQTQCCFKSTETIRTIRGRTATSTFTQLLSCGLWSPSSVDMPTDAVDSRLLAKTGSLAHCVVS